MILEKNEQIETFHTASFSQLDLPIPLEKCILHISGTVTNKSLLRFIQLTTKTAVWWLVCVCVCLSVCAFMHISDETLINEHYVVLFGIFCS